MSCCALLLCHAVLCRAMLLPPATVVAPWCVHGVAVCCWSCHFLLHPPHSEGGAGAAQHTGVTTCQRTTQVGVGWWAWVFAGVFGVSVCTRLRSPVHHDSAHSQPPTHSLPPFLFCPLFLPPVSLTHTLHSPNHPPTHRPTPQTLTPPPQPVRQCAQGVWCCSSVCC